MNGHKQTHLKTSNTLNVSAALLSVLAVVVVVLCLPAGLVAEAGPDGGLQAEGIAWAADGDSRAEGSLRSQVAASGRDGFPQALVAAQEGVVSVEPQVTGRGAVTVRSADGSKTAQVGEILEAAPGEAVTVDAQPAEGYYLAQLRYSQDGGQTYERLATGDALPVGDADMAVCADFVSKVWDGTIDVTWFDPEAYGPVNATPDDEEKAGEDGESGSTAATTVVGEGDESGEAPAAADAAGDAPEIQTDYYLTYPAQFAGLAAIVNGIFNDYPTTPVLKDGAEQVYKGKKGNAEYLNGQPVVRPDVDEQGESALDGSKLYAAYSSQVRITSLERGRQLSDERESTTVVVGDAGVIRGLFKHADKNPLSQNLATTADYYLGACDFSGKTVHIEADMDFGGVREADGTWSAESPLFMPVGGQFCMLPDNGYSKLSASFCGVLDGGGHTFANVYCERYANTEYGDSQSIGIVGRMGVHDDDDASVRPVNPTVRNICLESGMFSGRRSVGCIVGKFGKTSFNNLDGSMGAIVENCVNKASAFATDKKGLGGIVGASWNGGVIQNCANLGAISHVGSLGQGVPTGGIVGSNEVCVRNCYSAGAIAAEDDAYAMGIGTRNGDFNHFVSNCYWLTGTAAGGGYYGTLAGGGGEGQGSCTEFGPGTKHATLTAADLNAGGSGAAGAWVDADGVNVVDGASYPALWYQAADVPDCTLRIEQPEHGTLVVRSPYGAGRAYASGDVVPFGTMLVLECAPDAGYAVRSYRANGDAVDGDVTIVYADTAIGAEVALAKSATASLSKRISVPRQQADDSFALEVTKDGTALVDGAFSRVADFPVAAGDAVYEGDRLKIRATPVEGAELDEAEYEYLDTFGISVGSSRVTSGVYTVKADDVGSGSLSITAVRDVTYRSWYSVADVSWYTTHTDEDEYTLTTIEQLAGVAALVYSGSTDFEDKTIRLAADVSTAPEQGMRSWLSIGRSADRAFKGTFDGGGHIFTMENEPLYNSFGGLFGYVGAGGTVRNVVVEGEVPAGWYAAGVCGVLQMGTLENCVNRAKVSDYDAAPSAMHVGGICGYVDGGAMRGCVNEGDVSGAQNVGGIAGSLCVDSAGASSAVVEGCYSTGNVAGERYVGGVSGRLQGPTEAHHTVVSNCYVAGSVAPRTSLADADKQADFLGAVFGSAYRYYDVSDVCWLESAAEEACGAVSTVKAAATSTLSLSRVGADELSGAPCLSPAGLLVRNATSANDGFPLAPATMGDALLVRFLGGGEEVLDAVAVDAGGTADFAGSVDVPAPDAKGHYAFSGWVDVTGARASLDGIAADADLRASFARQAHSFATKTTLAPTYAKPGVAEHTCTACGYVTTSTLAKKKVTAKVALTAKTKAQSASKLRVAWKKAPASAKVTGYQVYVKQGSKSRYVRVPGAKKTSKVVAKLAGGTKCTVKVRAYVKEAGKFYYGPWSKAKKAKMKAKKA